jgi:hypothetical protein
VQNTKFLIYELSHVVSCRGNDHTSGVNVAFFIWRCFAVVCLFNRSVRQWIAIRIQ